MRECVGELALQLCGSLYQLLDAEEKVSKASDVVV